MELPTLQYVLENFPKFIVAGAGVGFTIGLTGVGGGSLMTPILLMFGIPAHIAIGTDLFYASATKVNAVYSHYRHGTIRWRIALTLLAGSLPASLATSWMLHTYFHDANEYKSILTTALGLMLMLTGLVMALRRRIMIDPEAFTPGIVGVEVHRHETLVTWLTGLLLGVFVTLTSVGAGAFGTVVLMIVYSRLPIINIIGSELAHAVPLTLVAGLGHMALDNIDFTLLVALLLGSVPATHLGAKMSTRLPEGKLTPVLALVLFALGVKYSWPLFSHLLT